MGTGFRASMNWLHTWAGVTLGGLLFAIFWMGTLSVFDREIDRWMSPMTRVPAAPISLDRIGEQLARLPTTARSWYVVPPSEREPTLRLSYADAHGYRTHHIDPGTGTMLPDPETLAGTEFIFPFHFELHLHAADLGIWIVGVAGMAMLLLCVSGVIIHRKIFADFFTFRPRKKPRRMLLDLHNVAGVIGLPFHVAITLSGLVIFAYTYFPTGWQALYAQPKDLWADVSGGYARPASGVPGTLGSLDRMVAKARGMWGGDQVEYLSVTHPGDAAAYVMIERSPEKYVTHVADRAWFDAQSGALLARSLPSRPAMQATQFLAGLHLVRFHHWTLRWLYFVLGLAGCVLIATGYLFWLESRRKRHLQLGLRGVRVVEALTIGSVTGMILATFAFFVANRLIPLGASIGGTERAALEVWFFFAVLIAAFLHAALRKQQAWVEQCVGVAVLGGAAVLLNWVTTGDHLIRSLTHPHLWPIAVMDLLLIVAAAAAGYLAWSLTRRGRVAAPPLRAMASA